MIELIIAFIVGCWLGSAVSRAWMALSFREILRDLGVTEQQLRKLARDNDIDLTTENPQNAAEESTLTPMEIKIEEVQGMLYAYRLDNNQFLGQGIDRDQLIDRLKENLTNVRLIISEDNGSRLLQKNNV